MKHIDITFDLETAALCPTAAPLSLGAVAWDRNGKNSPFIETKDVPSEFFAGIDLTSCFTKGFTIDRQTQEWWMKQSEEAQQALLAGEKHSIKDVVLAFFDWIREIRSVLGAETVCLWSQGTDFDVAILRNVCYVLDIDFAIKHYNFRDHRSVCMEFAAKVLEEPNSDACIPAKDPRKAYALVEEYNEYSPSLEGRAGVGSSPSLEGRAGVGSSPSLEGRAGVGSSPHTPVFDCKKSIYSTWQIMHQI